MSDEPIFVLGLMRSGTTFVQRVLNCHPGVTIWGEHGAALRPLLTQLQPAVLTDHHRQRIAAGYKRRHGVIGRLSDVGAFDAYASPVPPERFEASVDEVVRTHMTSLFTTGLDPGVRWGFKETRYAGRATRGLARVFPEARFVFVTREPAPWASSVLRAPFWHDLAPDQVDDDRAAAAAIGRLLDLWSQRTRMTVDFVAEDPGRRLLVAQERVRDLDAVATLYARLDMGEPPRRVKRVLGNRAGSSDAAAEWTPDLRGRLEDRIAAAVTDRDDLAPLLADIDRLALR